MKPQSRPLWLSVISGCLWALIGFVVMWSADFHHTTAYEAARAAVGGVLVAPVIGLLMGGISKVFDDFPLLIRVVLAGVTLYLSAFSFLLTSGVCQGLIFGRMPEQLLFNSLAMAWVGLAFTGYFVVLWPLSYFNHSLVSRAWARRGEVS